MKVDSSYSTKSLFVWKGKLVWWNCICSPSQHGELQNLDSTGSSYSWGEFTVSQILPMTMTKRVLADNSYDQASINDYLRKTYTH